MLKLMTSQPHNNKICSSSKTYSSPQLLSMAECVTLVEGKSFPEV